MMSLCQNKLKLTISTTILLLFLPLCFFSLLSLLHLLPILLVLLASFLFFLYFTCLFPHFAYPLLFYLFIFFFLLPQDILINSTLRKGRKQTYIHKQSKIHTQNNQHFWFFILLMSITLSLEQPSSWLPNSYTFLSPFRIASLPFQFYTPLLLIRIVMLHFTFFCVWSFLGESSWEISFQSVETEPTVRRAIKLVLLILVLLL